jgi:hypothetical protein
MVNTIRCSKPVLGHKGNKYKGYKWILAILKLRGLIKIKVKRQGKRSSVRLSVKRGQ